MSQPVFTLRKRSIMFCEATLPSSTSRGRSTGWLSARIFILLAALIFGGYSGRSAESDKGTPPADWLAWQQARQESIAGTNGWTTLISLKWLPDGQTYVGADSTNQLVLPTGRAVGAVGVFSRSGKTVRFAAAPGVVATVGGVPVQELEMKTDATENPTKLTIGVLTFVVIERGERFGVRVRDPESPARLHFAGLKYFPYDPAWRIAGRFEPFTLVKIVRVPDASGGIQQLTSPGELVFTNAGQEYRLAAVAERGDDEFFVIFKDRTAGDTTYPAGRFLYVAQPDTAGRVTLDFNRAFNPPCGFTLFATCPRPPIQNTLPFAIPAGERKPVEPE